VNSSSENGFPVGIQHGALATELGVNARQSAVIFGAVRSVVESSGEAGLQGAPLLALAAHALGLHGNWRDHACVTPQCVAEHITDPTARARLVNALVIPACIEGAVTEAGESMVREFARVLSPEGAHWAGLVGALRRRQVAAVKVQLMRRSPDMRRMLKRIWHEDGVRGVLNAISFTLGLYRDRVLAQRYRALGALPAGSFGRNFHDTIVGRSLAFPGEAGGIPEKMIHHDLLHVVNNYMTDAPGECELAGFYAGFCEGDGFTFIVIALATFQLGLAVSPSAVTPERGKFDPTRVLAAYLRGRRLHVDVMGPWDYWSLMPLPIATVRQHLGIADADMFSGSEVSA
jgi:hypothetical protein